LDVSGLGAGRNALDHKVQSPRQTDAHRPTDPTQGNTFAQQVHNQRTPFIGNEMRFGTGHTLASTGFALMMLLPTVNMAVLLERYRSTR
jgi:hypothetical protein